MTPPPADMGFLIIMALLCYAMWAWVKPIGYSCRICGTTTGDHGKNCPRRKR